MRLVPDDSIYQVRKVWLGPVGMTFPWVARYLAYGIWLGAFLAVLLFERITPLHVGLPPVWEFAATTLFTYLFLGYVDQEKPARSVLQTLWADLTGPRAEKPTITVYRLRVTRYRWILRLLNGGKDQTYRLGKELR